MKVLCINLAIDQVDASISWYGAQTIYGKSLIAGPI